MIGDDVIVTILGIAGGQCRIGIQAPKATKIFREEVLLRVKKEQAAAVVDPIPDAPWAAP